MSKREGEAREGKGREGVWVEERENAWKNERKKSRNFAL